MKSSQATVVNYTSPELNHLAAELSVRKWLRVLIRPYANTGRRLEHYVEALPIARNYYLGTIGRRKLLPDLDPDRVDQVAIVRDFLLALAGRSGRWGKPIKDGLHWNIQRVIADHAAHRYRDSQLTIASYQVALPSFKTHPGRKILNYPIAHHRFIQKLVKEESERVPEFASTLPKWDELPRWLEPQLDEECELADQILVGSSFSRDAFVAEGIPAEKIIVQPYGMDPLRFTPAWEMPLARKHDYGFRALFVGQLTQRKGFSYLLDAYRIVKGKGIELVAVGGFYGSSEPVLAHKDLFTHIPHVAQTELAKIYRSADVFVFPTLIEGMPLVVLEAMASGLPVIVTPNGPGDIVRDGIEGFVVPIRDPQAIAEKIELLRSDRVLREQMARAARKRALEFSWQAYRTKALEKLGFDSMSDI